MGSAANGSYTVAAKRMAGRSVLAIGSGIAAGSRLVAKGVGALTADSGDREAVRFLRFATLELGPGAGAPACDPLPVLLIGLATGFQVWRLDGANPAELVSRRDGPVKLLEALPTPRASPEHDALRADRPLLAVVPPAEAAGGAPQQHSLQLYSLRSHGYVRSLGFSGEVLAVRASGRLLVVALRGQLQAFDAATLHHTFSCLTYAPPPPPPLPGGAARPQQHQVLAQGLAGGASEGGNAQQQQPRQQPRAGGAAPPAPPPAPFDLGPRWLAYAADTPVPPASGQAVAQRLPLARRDSASSAGRGGGGAPDGEGPAPGGGSGAAGAANGLTTAAVTDAALQAAAKGGQQLRAAGSAGLRYLGQQYQSWRAGPQQQRDLDAREADEAVAGTVVVRDAGSRAVVAHFRAHTSPLAALRFSPGGALLATASAAGHSINLFRLVPPAAAAEAGAAGGAGHAVHLYRLYRGVTPAAVLDLAIAPDAAWLAASTARGTTHLFHTPAAAPGARPPAQAGAGPEEAGVAGRPPRTAAAGRARRPGLLGSGVAGAATSAARSLVAGQAPEAAPIAAAFLPAAPASPCAAAPGAGASLCVVTSDGLLTRHLLRAPPGEAGGGAATGLQGQDQEGGAAVPAAVLEEADRWDVARHASWPEREEPLPSAAAGEEPAAAGLGPAPAEQQQAWLAQADSGALAAAEAGSGQLWQASQFRFYELQMEQLQRRQPARGPASHRLEDAAADDLNGFDAGDAVWLEQAPARAVQQQ